MVVTLGQQYNVGEKPIVILYTYINRHAGTPEKQQRQNNVVGIGNKYGKNQRTISELSEFSHRGG